MVVANRWPRRRGQLQHSLAGRSDDNENPPVCGPAQVGGGRRPPSIPPPRDPVTSTVVVPLCGRICAALARRLGMAAVGTGGAGGTAPPGIAHTEQRERSRGAGTCPRLRRDPTTVCCFLLLLVYAGGSALSKLPPHYVGGAPATQNDACFLSLSEPRADCRGMLSPPLVS